MRSQLPFPACFAARPSKPRAASWSVLPWYSPGAGAGLAEYPTPIPETNTMAAAAATIPLFTMIPPVGPGRIAGARAALSRQFVQILDERHRRPVVALHLRVGRLDQVILVRRMGAAAVAQPEMPRGQTQGRIGE